MIRYLVLIPLLLLSYGGISQSISASGPVSFCAGGSVTLSVTNTAGITGYQWIKDGINIPGQTTVSINVGTSGSYTVKLDRSALNPDTTIGPVVVSSNPIPVANFSFTPNGACSGTAVVFTAAITSGTAPFSYKWDFGDGGNSVAANPSHSFTSLGCGTGTFTVKLTVTDSRGCSHTISKTVSVLQAPDVQIKDLNIFSPFNNCSNSPTVANPTYTLTVDNNSPDKACISGYNINWGDGNIKNNVTFPITHTYLFLGAYNLLVSAAGINGCNNSKTYVIANQSNPAGSLGTLGSTTNLCAPAVVPFTVSNWVLNSPGTNYTLSFGDGTSVTIPHPLNTKLTDDTIYHEYKISSCPTSSFTAILSVQNACDRTPYTAGNIQIRVKPTADF